MQARKDDALAYHRDPRPGKTEIRATKPCLTSRDLALAYSPGVAYPCLEIRDRPEAVYEYTNKSNLVAVISNGTAVLGLGNIGPAAGKPVMEGKAVLFKRFADIDVFDLEVDASDPDLFCAVVQALAPTFGGINLEDIKAPECFIIERRLTESLDIPVMHDDQHGTAIICGAAFINALDLAGKEAGDARIVCSGAGAAAVACVEMLIELGARPENVLMLDSRGILHTEREGLTGAKARFARDTPLRTLAEAMDGADMFLGLSVGGVVSADMVRTMAENPIVFALANPTPEIDYPTAVATRSDVLMATGRSDYPNQVNNVLGFPYIFRAALDVQARSINQAMKVAAARALSELARSEVTDQVRAAYDGASLRFGPGYFIPKPFDERILYSVAPAVAIAAGDTGVARRPIQDVEAYRDELAERLHPSASVMRWVFEVARSAPPRIVFPSGGDPRVLRACEAIVESRVARPVLIGVQRRIRETAGRVDVDLDALGIEIIDPQHAEGFDDMAAALLNRRKRRGMTDERARWLLQNEPDYLAAMLVQTRRCDGMINGLHQSFPEATRPILRCIGARDDESTVCGVYLVFKRNELFFFADTAVHIDPDAEQLARIARTVAGFARIFDIDPRVALLSFSTFGSASSPETKKVARACELVREAEPDLRIDGPLQADVALDPATQKRLYGFNTLRGRANVLIFPTLDAGNIAYKLLDSIGRSYVIGPILLGVARPANVLQRDSDVRAVVNLTALTAFRAVRGNASGE